MMIYLTHLTSISWGPFVLAFALLSVPSVVVTQGIERANADETSDKNASKDNGNARLPTSSVIGDDDISTVNEKSTFSGLDVRSLMFNDIEAGATPLAKLREKWGSPDETVNENGASVLVYQIPPFRSVDVSVDEDIVTSIVIYLDDEMTADELATQLNLLQISPVNILDDQEDILGRSFPERGVTFGFHPQAKGELVAQILLEPISSEPFLLRAQYGSQHENQRAFTDLNLALSLDPELAAAHHQKAQLLVRVGRYLDGAKSVDRALDINPKQPEYILTRAGISETIGYLDQANEDVRNVLDQNKVPHHVRAQALLQAGNLAMRGPQPDYQKALQCHQRAIELAAPLGKDNRFAIRRAAKRTLIDAHVAVAKAIAYGNWKNKKEIVPKWLDRAAALAEELIQHDDGAPLLRLYVNQQALSALAGIRKLVTPAEIVRATIARAEQLEKLSDDTLCQQEKDWILAQALVDVLRIEFARGQTESAKKHGLHAVKVLENLAEQRRDNLDYTLILGEVYFRIGSIHAVQLEDHPTAVNWYTKSLDLLERPRPITSTFDDAQMGEWFVSMAVSLWEVREREKAINLTEHGTKLIERAVDEESVSGDSLHVPYSNLTRMYEHIGDNERAEKYAKRTADAQGEASTLR